MIHRLPTPRTHAHGGFTLVELMISIALVLLLMLGINRVFQVTGEAVGTNAALSTAVRDGRAAQAVFSADFNAFALDSPAIIIRSERVSAFRNKADAEGDRDYDPTAGPAGTDLAKRTVDLDGNGTEGEPGVLGEITPPSTYNDRSHRIDKLSFFARGTFRRQTGGGLTPAGAKVEEYISDMSSSDAWIWYGHLLRPDERSPVTSNQQFEHRRPGQDPDVAAGEYNDRNFYASDFVLGRMAMLLVEGTDTTVPPDEVGDEIRDRNGTLQRFISRNDTITPPPTPPRLSPLVQNVRSNEQQVGDQWAIQWGRYDLANTSIAQFRKIMGQWFTANMGLPFNSPAQWFNLMGDWRFEGDPTPIRPINPDNVARTTPVFLEHCSQFIVEYAGDFLNQDPVTGALDATAPYQSDGVTDFIIDTSVAGAPVRRMRWYGMPRDVAGSPNTGGPDGIIRGNTTDPNLLVDVVPLRDVLAAGGYVYTPPPTAPGNKFIERRWPQSAPFAPTPPTFYSGATGGMTFDGWYIAAWGPDTSDQPRPQMIRIVFTIDDPTGRIADGQTYEYVYRLGG